jgi:hypothetical protein
MIPRTHILMMATDFDLMSLGLPRLSVLSKSMMRLECWPPIQCPHRVVCGWSAAGLRWARRRGHELAGKRNSSVDTVERSSTFVILYANIDAQHRIFI